MRRRTVCDFFFTRTKSPVSRRRRRRLAKHVSACKSTIAGPSILLRKEEATEVKEVGAVVARTCLENDAEI